MEMEVTSQQSSSQSNVELVTNSQGTSNELDKVLEEFGAAIQPLEKESGQFKSQQAVKFRPLPQTKIVFYDAVVFRRKYGDTFQSFHFIRSAHDTQQYVLNVGVRGCIEIKRFRKLLNKLAKIMCNSQYLYIRVCSMSYKKGVCMNMSNYVRDMAEYRRENIFVMIDDKSNTRIKQQKYMDNIDIVKMHEQLKNEFVRLMNAICITPNAYDTVLKQLRYMSSDQLRKFLHERDIETLYKEVQSQVFDMATGNVCKKDSTYAILRDENVKLLICNQMHDKVYPQFLMCALGRTDYVHDHPSFNYSIHKNVSQLYQANVLELAQYHPDFIVSVLLVARYFARVCMQESQSVSSNQATLLMYGAAGAGKSLITNAIMRYANGYKWNCDSIYQSPLILSSSVIVMEEIRLEQLNSALFKQVLDYTSSVKIEVKNTHPVDATRHCPVIMNTNENVQTFFSSSAQLIPTQNYRQKQQFSQHKIDAIHRRLNIVPFVDKFTRLHSIECISAKTNRMKQLLQEFYDIERVTPQLFNFMLAFGLYQTELRSFSIRDQLKAFYKQLIGKFQDTLFFDAYMKSKESVDAMLNQLEEVLGNESVSERQIQRQFSRVSSELESLIDEEVREQLVSEKQPITQEIWNEKKYRTNDSCKFMQRLLLMDLSKRESKSKLELEGIAEQWREILENDLEIPDFEEGNDDSCTSVVEDEQSVILM